MLLSPILIFITNPFFSFRQVVAAAHDFLENQLVYFHSGHDIHLHDCIRVLRFPPYLQLRHIQRYANFFLF